MPSSHPWTRTARLVEAAVALRRRIWASLPWHVRLAEFFTRLAVSYTDAFGATIYAEFLRHGITNMPDIHGRPASELASHGRLADRLPHGYGGDFGKKAYSTLMSRYHDPSFVEDVLATYLENFLGWGSAKLKAGTPLKSAESYVMTGIVREGLNVMRSRSRKREESVESIGEGGEEHHHDVPVHDEETMDRLLLRALPRMKSRLERIHPDAPLYVKLSIIDGYTDHEIIGDPEHGVPSMLPNPETARGTPMSEKYWNLKYKGPIFQVLKDNFEHLRAAV